MDFGLYQNGIELVMRSCEVGDVFQIVGKWCSEHDKSYNPQLFLHYYVDAELASVVVMRMSSGFGRINRSGA